MVEELLKMGRMKKKVELEALNVYGAGLISKLVERKIIIRDWV